eukprot:5793468-Lingulodinium_polyedra.AAC.1
MKTALAEVGEARREGLRAARDYASKSVRVATHERGPLNGAREYRQAWVGALAHLGRAAGRPDGGAGKVGRHAAPDTFEEAFEAVSEFGGAIRDLQKLLAEQGWCQWAQAALRGGAGQAHRL